MIINPQDNILQIELDRFHKEATENNFITNKKKTTIMVFNATRKYAFSPEGDSMSKVRGKRSTLKSGFFFMKCER